MQDGENYVLEADWKPLWNVERCKSMLLMWLVSLILPTPTILKCTSEINLVGGLGGNATTLKKNYSIVLPRVNVCLIVSALQMLFFWFLASIVDDEWAAFSLITVPV